MKILFLIMAFALYLPASAQTYQAGASNRPNFGRSAALDAQESAANSNTQTRTFSNYSARHRDWSKGVQTQGVQTETAGTAQQSAPKTFEEQVAQTDQAVDARINVQRAPAAGAASVSGKKAATPAQEAVSAPASAAAAGAAGAQAAPAAAGDPAAAMAQVQGLMKGLEGLQKMAGSMGAMMGGNAGAASAGGSKGGAADKQVTDALGAHSADIAAFMNVSGGPAGK